MREITDVRKTTEETGTERGPRYMMQGAVNKRKGIHALYRERIDKAEKNLALAGVIGLMCGILTGVSVTLAVIKFMG